MAELEQMAGRGERSTRVVDDDRTVLGPRRSVDEDRRQTGRRIDSTSG